MRVIRTGKSKKRGAVPKEGGRSGGAETLALVCLVLTMVLLLSFICFDGDKYPRGEESVAASLSYTPPEREEPMGFWEIFSRAVTDLLF